jgi:hypothetical protein
MAKKSALMQALKAELPAKQFAPYCFISKEADAMTVYVEADPDYSERLTEHVTIYRSLATNEVVGCRIKGISGIIEDLPNYIHVDHDGIKLSAIFLPFRGAATDERARAALNDLAKSANEHDMVYIPSAAV